MIETKFNSKLLLFTTLVISICSIIYELIISGVSSYLLGDSITQFSITIGLYMSAMGVGSYLSRYIKRRLMNFFVIIEVMIGMIGGFSSLILFMSNIYTEIYVLIMYFIIISIGIFVGMEIPILTRAIEEQKSNIRENLANIFTFDYIGGLVGSIAFPLLLLPTIGFISTSFFIGVINLVIANVIVFQFKEYIKKAKMVQTVVLACTILLFGFLIFGQKIANSIEDGLYRDDIIYQDVTKYQNIVMTKHKDDLRLYLDGNLQFSSSDEYRYHEALVHVPMSFVKGEKRVLVLGGGDGLAAREILKYEEVKEIVLVDIDQEMVDLCKTNKQIQTLNQGSLENEKLTIINGDAYLYAKENKELFDVIIVDLPDPNNESLNKLYTNVFYNYLKANLSEAGVVVVQSTSPYYAKNSFWCINKTLATQFDQVIPYHLQVPSFGEWGFNMASKNAALDTRAIKVTVDTRYLTEDTAKAMFIFAKDEMLDMNRIKINKLLNPALIEYYNNDVENW